MGTLVDSILETGKEESLASSCVFNTLSQQNLWRIFVFEIPVGQSPLYVWVPTTPSRSAAFKDKSGVSQTTTSKWCIHVATWPHLGEWAGCRAWFVLIERRSWVYIKHQITDECVKESNLHYSKHPSQNPNTQYNNFPSAILSTY